MTEDEPVLVDLPDQPYGEDEFRIREILRAEGYRVPEVEQISTGMYWGDAHGMHLVQYPFSPELDHYPHKSKGFDRAHYTDEAWAELEERMTRERLQMYMEGVKRDDPQDYGVCDSPEQVTERWPLLETSPRRFVIFFREVRKEDQPEQGGWRWHKWGGYIGTFEPQCEYLYDEVGIDGVLIFQIHEFKETDGE